MHFAPVHSHIIYPNFSGTGEKPVDPHNRLERLAPFVTL